MMQQSAKSQKIKKTNFRVLCLQQNAYIADNTYNTGEIRINTN